MPWCCCTLGGWSTKETSCAWAAVLVVVQTYTHPPRLVNNDLENLKQIHNHWWCPHLSSWFIYRLLCQQSSVEGSFRTHHHLCRWWHRLVTASYELITLRASAPTSWLMHVSDGTAVSQWHSSIASSPSEELVGLPEWGTHLGRCRYQQDGDNPIIIIF